MTLTPDQLKGLRLVITENLRIQRSGAKSVPYIDVSNALTDIIARQNHTVFARRGCGKTLLLHFSAKQLGADTKTLYLNCEDYKNHTFPNVLVEILDALFAELESHLSGWFGRKKKSRDLIRDIRTQLTAVRVEPDEMEENVRAVDSRDRAESVNVKVDSPVGGSFGAQHSNADRHEVERTYKRSDKKIQKMNLLLPQLKRQVREFFEISTSVKAIMIQVDDLYHLRRTDQPFVMDYLHRLCKDLPLYFKVATLRHASVLYVERDGQPTGAQERHDYQPINIDYSLADFAKTETQNRQILHAFAKLAGIGPSDIDALFKGEGFRRLVMAGGGVPRDVLSLFLEVLQSTQLRGDPRVGKDDVRILSRGNFERRIEELKQDSEGEDQGNLLKGIYVLREFCLERKTNVFFVSEQMLQQNDEIRELLYRLLDYRIVHSLGSALTHKSRSGGTYHALMIDIGCYAHMRRLDGKFDEVDITSSEAKERMRSSPILEQDLLAHLWEAAPLNPEVAMLQEEVADV